MFQLFNNNKYKFLKTLNSYITFIALYRYLVFYYYFAYVYFFFGLSTVLYFANISAAEFVIHLKVFPVLYGLLLYDVLPEFISEKFFKPRISFMFVDDIFVYLWSNVFISDYSLYFYFVITKLLWVI
jgi:hypothetical protein